MVLAIMEARGRKERIKTTTLILRHLSPVCYVQSWGVSGRVLE